MLRQLQSKHAPVRGATKVAGISQGGSGETTIEGAIHALDLISLDSIGHDLGIAGSDPKTGKLPIDNVGTNYGNLPLPGLSIEGPLQLVHGASAVYHLTEYKSDMVYTVSVDTGIVSVTKDEITITAPPSGPAVVLTINGRSITIPIGVFKPLKTKILTPVQDGVMAKVFQVTAERYAAEPLTYTPWVKAEVGTSSITIPDSASAIEFEGRSGVTGKAEVTVKGKVYACGVATVRRAVAIDNNSALYSSLQEDGTLKYRFIVPSSEHISTDWELSLDEGFTKIIKSSYNDTVNLQKWTVNIAPNTYYVRVRYKGRFSL